MSEQTITLEGVLADNHSPDQVWAEPPIHPGKGTGTARTGEPGQAPIGGCIEGLEVRSGRVQAFLVTGSSVSDAQSDGPCE